MAKFLLLLCCLGRSSLSLCLEQPSKYGYSEVRARSCSKVLIDTLGGLIFDNTTPIDRYLDLSPGTIAFLLSTLKETSVWNITVGIVIYGSRSHKLWGSSYDLDVAFIQGTGSTSEVKLGAEFVRQPKDSPQQPVLFDEFKRRTGVTLDVSVLPSKAFSEIPSVAQWRELEVSMQMEFRPFVEGFIDVNPKHRLNQLSAKGNRFARSYSSYGNYLQSFRKGVGATLETAGYSSKFIGASQVFIFYKTPLGSDLMDRLRNLRYVHVYEIDSNTIPQFSR